MSLAGNGYNFLLTNNIYAKMFFTNLKILIANITIAKTITEAIV